MRIPLMLVLVLALFGCANVAHVGAEEPTAVELSVFCEVNVVFLQDLFHDVIDINGSLRNMIHEDTENFVPILFAQFKMESLGIMLWSVMVEMCRTADDGKVSDITLTMLDQYTELLRYDLIKAKMFKGMIANLSEQEPKTREQLILNAAIVGLQLGYDILTNIREVLGELR